MTARERIAFDRAELRKAAHVLEKVAYSLAGQADAEIISQLIGMSAKAMMIEDMLQPRSRIN